MNNTELKELIELYADEDELDKIIVLEGDEFADGCVGITDDYCLVYSYNRLVESLSRQNDWTEEEAMEWIDYNTIRSIPYMPDDCNKPVIIYEF